MTINEFMTGDHRSCDEDFATSENAIASKNKEFALEAFKKFQDHMLKHFEMEEQVMFPEYNNAPEQHCNPTGVMIMEHDQMRTLMDQISSLIEAESFDDALGLCENLLFVMQQHNMKEEQMMYNMADAALNSEEIIEKMKQVG